MNVECSYHLEIGHAYPATYATPGNSAKGRYTVHGQKFTEQVAYINKGTFERTQSSR